MISPVQTFLALPLLHLALSPAADGAPGPDIMKLPVDETKFTQDNNTSEYKAGLSRIINGTDGDVRDYPWMASILSLEKMGWAHRCGGALITQNHVLTAGHCVATRKHCHGQYQFYTTGVWVNNIIWKNPKIILNERYYYCALKGRYAIENDIALLYLQRKPHFIALPTIQLPNHNEPNYFGSTGMVIGWGRTNFSDTDTSRTIQKLLVGIYRGSHPACVNSYSNPQSTICLVSRDNEGVCRGDSGGPLFATQPDGSPVLLGIASYGLGECDTSMPDYYTRVYSHMGWIISKISWYQFA